MGTVFLNGTMFAKLVIYRLASLLLVLYCCFSRDPTQTLLAIKCLDIGLFALNPICRLEFEELLMIVRTRDGIISKECF